jgi:Arc/MetJ family transcription regulator
MMGRKVRTNIVIDEELVTDVMSIYGLESRREAVDFALRKTLGREERFADPWTAALELEGIWADMTDEEAREIWGDEVPDGPNARRPRPKGSRRKEGA